MKTNVILVLDTRRIKSDGTCSILLRIVHHRNSSQISTGYSVLEKDWDKKEKRIKITHKGTESVARLNNIISKKKSEAMDIISKLDEMKTLDSFTVLQLKEIIERKSDKVSFVSYTENLIMEMKKTNRIGNARAYKSALSAVKNFFGDKPISFQEINYPFLLRFESNHLLKGYSLNGLSTYLRTIRAIYNSAIKDGIIEEALYPFKKYQIKATKTRKRAISIDAIKKIEQLELEIKHPLFHTRCFFLISFYMRGIPFADLAQLKLSDIIEGRIYYQRQKTDKPYNIKITDEIQAILNDYIKGKKKEDFIFPIIKSTELQEQYNEVEGARKRYNKKLKQIAVLCGIEENLTSYVSRHSFATRAKNLGVPIATISDMLGHADTKTTEIYLDSLQSDLMDEAHEKIIR